MTTMNVLKYGAIDTDSSQVSDSDSVNDDQVRLKYIGCLLGGAVGDALGAPVEFLSAATIRNRFGKHGIQELVPAFGKVGAITDDTQMTLFTADALLRSRFSKSKPSLDDLRVYIAAAYQRWLHTQGCKNPLQSLLCNGWLLEQEDLFSCRAPGNTCLSGLRAMRNLTDLAKNDSKGCGGVMRVAPIGMYFASLSRHHDDQHERLLEEAFELGCHSAAITHGHSTGQLSSGVFAAIIMELLSGVPLLKAIDVVVTILSKRASCNETMQAVKGAVQMAAKRPNDSEALQLLGAGWVADEALAIALYCALSAKDFRSSVELAVNHSGDSDSTGSMTGQLLGAIYGRDAIPESWLGPIELDAVIGCLADDLTLRDWSEVELTSAAVGLQRHSLNILCETAALRAYAVMVNTQSVKDLQPLLADDFAHESQRNFDAYKSKKAFLVFANGLHDALRKSGGKAYAEMGRVVCSQSIMTSSTAEGAESVASMEDGTETGYIRPCVLLTHGDRDAPEVVVLAEIAGNKLKRIELCVIPGPELAQRSGEYPA